MRITESQLRRVVKRMISEQFGMDEDPYYTFVTEATMPGGNDDMLADAADQIRAEVGPESPEAHMQIVDNLMSAARDAGSNMTEDDAEEFAYGIMRGDY